jgi:acyl-CoA thioesterase-2
VLPDVPSPDETPVFEIPRLFSFEGRKPPQPYGELGRATRFWARCTTPVGDDPFLNACALTYLSDISTGLARFENADYGASSSLDHALWFHRPIRIDDWVLTDLVPHTAAGGRGWYTGEVFQRDGVLVASLAQESLFRKRRVRDAR